MEWIKVASALFGTFGGGGGFSLIGTAAAMAGGGFGVGTAIGGIFAGVGALLGGSGIYFASKDIGESAKELSAEARELRLFISKTVWPDINQTLVQLREVFVTTNSIGYLVGMIISMIAFQKAWERLEGLSIRLKKKWWQVLFRRGNRRPDNRTKFAQLSWTIAVAVSLTSAVAFCCLFIQQFSQKCLFVIGTVVLAFIFLPQNLRKDLYALSKIVSVSIKNFFTYVPKIYANPRFGWVYIAFVHLCSYFTLSVTVFLLPELYFYVWNYDTHHLCIMFIYGILSRICWIAAGIAANKFIVWYSLRSVRKK